MGAMTSGDDDAGATTDEQPHERVERHRDGSVRARGPMLGDELHGAWRWFRLDGTIMRSGTFDRGAQVGEWTTYDRQGRPYKVTRMG
jgi:antitoxin component YwqK of YwqJK toxin-antitoxin module